MSSTLPTVGTAEREAPESPCVHELFERHAGERPDAVALVVGDESLTYRELNERANALAHLLRKRGVGPDALVGICMFRCVEMIVSLLAVLKAGGAYVPIDPGYPKQRLAAMLNDLELSLLLTTGELQPVLPAFGNEVLPVDLMGDALAAEPTDNPGGGSRDDLCYAIFTSGSTGQAKAAAVYHKGWANLLAWFASEFEITADDRVLVISSFSFDITQRSIAMPLVVGGQLHLLDSRVYDPALIRETAARDGITLVNCAPSTCYPLIENARDEWHLLNGVRIVFLGGEAISASRLREFARSPGCATEFANVYGVAECSDVSSFHRLRDFERYAATSVPIGKPIFNSGVHVLDEDLQPVPAGERGEICITGIGVGKGYVNDPLLTAEKFVASPFEPGALLYRTGDMGRTLPDGGLEMIGRVDYQVKIRGNRIDLGDVETNFRSHPDVREAVVVRKTFGPGDVRLVAYVVPSHRLEAEEDLAHSIHQVMKDRLPEYMLPSRTLILDELPLTPNGKVDRTALEERAATFPAPAPEALPRTPLEREVGDAFAEVLQLDQIGIADNFFNYGGDSYLVTVLLARIAEVTGARLSIFEFLEHPTVANVARAVERRREEDEQEEAS
jgi:amino acid adenylation domain-containing protein